ncbi:MAG: pyruvate, phosphate dikinase [Deltaproteobacteria bacterium]|nr:MAG: pyruvate, phosphate dikinase [Deltaproteobacteria bacterium]
MNETRYVYAFGAEEDPAAMTPLLGMKGASLAQMARLGLPVPPGFTLTIDACRAYWAAGDRIPDVVREQVRAALSDLERQTGARLGDPAHPLVFSVRSGAAVPLPRMMDTVLNLGLNDQTVVGLAQRTGDARFAWDAYRRLLQMYGDIVMGVRTDVLDQLLERKKEGEGVFADSELSDRALRELVAIFQRKIFESTGRAFPQDPEAQLWQAIEGVFRSWNNRRALEYRNVNQIPHDLGTAVTVQVMVFGNLGHDSATGVAYTRDPNTGTPQLFGEWLPTAQGEDVVHGMFAPQPLNLASGAFDADETMEAALPEAYAELARIRPVLERHYRDMQHVEFTVERGRLWMLQTRAGKRSPEAEVRLAVDMVTEGLIDRAEAIRRVSTRTVEKLMHPRIDPHADRVVLAQGLGASPGAATGRLVFSAEAATEAAGRGDAVILVRRETAPEDVKGLLRAKGVLTTRGGMTSHAAVVARGMSKPCIVGCRGLELDPVAGIVTVGDRELRAGDVITIDGATGLVMDGAVPTISPEASAELERLMSWVDDFRRLRVRTNADTVRDCRIARDFGAEGIGLCRTEHMFFEDDRIYAVREMILAADEDGRRAALAKILPMQRGDFIGIFEVMAGLPVTIRLLDPPLHEFLVSRHEDIETMAGRLGVPYTELESRYRALTETNPMLGHRGCRLGITVPEIYEMQVRAILEAACEVTRRGVSVHPEIMIPLVADAREVELLRAVITSVADEVLAEQRTEVRYHVGTMIELPRACFAAGAIAGSVDFFSVGTNDLTQTTFGMSRDDCGRFLPLYVEMGILPGDPFVTIDPVVRELVTLATEKGRAVKPGLTVGICGEHGGEARTIRFCHDLGLDYVSCSPFRVPVARLAAAQAALMAGGEQA